MKILMPSYTPQQIDKALQGLPEELHEAVFSMETAQHIWDIRERYNLWDQKTDKLPLYAGYVLMGLMLPQEFQESLQKEMKIPKKTADQVAREINRFVFYPVKPALEQLHQMEIQVTAKVVTPKPRAQGEELPPPRSSGPDSYREPLE